MTRDAAHLKEIRKARYVVFYLSQTVEKVVNLEGNVLINNVDVFGKPTQKIILSYQSF